MRPLWGRGEEDVCLSAGNLPLVGLPVVTTSCDLFEVDWNMSGFIAYAR